MHHWCKIAHDSCTVSGWRSVTHAAGFPRRRPVSVRQPVEPGWPAERVVTREAPFVERLAYTRSQAAEALGLSRSTFIRRVLPYVETIEMPWGSKLIPVDELERLLAERRQAAKPRPAPPDSRPPAARARRSRSNESEPSEPKARACARSQPTSTPTGSRPPTAARNGGPQPSAPPSRAQTRLHPLRGSSSRFVRVGPSHVRANPPPGSCPRRLHGQLLRPLAVTIPAIMPAWTRLTGSSSRARSGWGAALKRTESLLPFYLRCGSRR